VGLAIHPITAAERARRTRVYEEALASIRLEGFELYEDVKAIYRRYIDGALTLDEVGTAINELDDREFGPLPVSRHKHPQEPARSHSCAVSLTRRYWHALKRGERTSALPS
jgi:hypothetical protein